MKFNIGQQVQINVSEEKGVVIGRAEYAESEPNYWIRYKTIDGRATEQWWAEKALTGI